MRGRPATQGFCATSCRVAFSRLKLDAQPSGTTCHLDAGGVEAACAQFLDQIPSSDLVVLSKFGKLEADRQGLWPAFEAAISNAKPVLTTVSAKHAEACKALVPTAVWLAPNVSALETWRQPIRSRS